jgi:Spy/CpxP family protein refolding chaperone
MVLALMLPLALSAQPGPRDGSFCGDGPRWDGRGHGGRHGGGPRDGFDGIGIHRLLWQADEIGLTEQQQDQLEKLALDFRTAQIDRRAAMEKARLQLHTLMADDNASETEVNRKIDELSALRAEMQKARFAHRRQVHDLLTEEQIEKIKELRRDRFDDARGRFGKERRMHDRGPGGGWGNP